MSEVFRLSGECGQGQVWRVDYPTLRLASELRGVHHERKRGRPCLVIAGPVAAGRPEYDIVTVVPLSRKPTLGALSRFDVPLPEGSGGLTADSFAPVYLAQPIAKAGLSTYMGDIGEERLDQVLATLLGYLGLAG